MGLSTPRELGLSFFLACRLVLGPGRVRGKRKLEGLYKTVTPFQVTCVASLGLDQDSLEGSRSQEGQAIGGRWGFSQALGSVGN